MAITLKPELERFIEHEVTKGRFASSAEVVEAALARLMLDQDFDLLADDEVVERRPSLDEMHKGNVIDWRQISSDLRSRIGVMNLSR